MAVPTDNTTAKAMADEVKGSGLNFKGFMIFVLGENPKA
jgi:hypothetical protein